MAVELRAEAHGGGVRVHLAPGTPLEVRRAQIIRRLGPPPSLRFLQTRSVAELTVGDVRELLAEYQWLSRAFT